MGLLVLVLASGAMFLMGFAVGLVGSTLEPSEVLEECNAFYKEQFELNCKANLQYQVPFLNTSLLINLTS